MKFSDVSIRVKLNICFGIIVTMVVVLVIAAVVSFSRLLAVNERTLTASKTIDQVNGIYQGALKIDGGQTAFAVTAEEAGLGMYHTGKREVASY
jgi:CHASE3 domain sensor protein